MDRNSASQTDGWVNERLATLKSGADWEPDVTTGMLRLRELQLRASWISKRWMLAATVVVGICICLLALPSPRVLAHRCLECSIAVLQSLSPTAPVQVNLKPQIGRVHAPDFSLSDASGRDVKLTELRGKVILVNFWATWCEGCQVEIPWFIAFEKQYADSGLVIIGVSMDADGWKSVRPWIIQKRINYPIVIGSEELGKLYGLEGMPLTVLVDREGRVADANSGIVDKAATETKIKALLKESTKNSVN